MILSSQRQVPGSIASFLIGADNFNQKWGGSGC